MIISSSRALTTKCWQKVFNIYHKNLSGQKAQALTDGGSVHAAIAVGLATKDWNLALKHGEEYYKGDMEVADTLEGEEYVYEEHLELVKALITKFAEGVQNETYEVIQPEASIDVAIPGSEHNCIWVHHMEWVRAEGAALRDVPRYFQQFQIQHEGGRWVEKWGVPDPTAIEEGRIADPHMSGMIGGGLFHEDDAQCPCWQPHRIVGQTDAIVSWNGLLWLLEHKTTSYTGEMFWAQWDLDLQPTLYLYGIWKQLGIMPRGVILNALSKPTGKQVAAWNAKRKDPSKAGRVQDYVGYERRAILREPADITRVEKNMVSLCNEWERRIIENDFRPALARTVCTEYNRRCDFHTPCMSHNEPNSFGGLYPRAPRYDDVKIGELVQIAKGKTTK